MIDVETEVFDRVARAVKAAMPSACGSSTREVAPKKFPTFQLSEISNVEASYLHDSSNEELGSIVTFEADCYSNLRTGARAQAKQMAQLIDAEMRAMGFERTFGQQVYNAADSSVHRYTARYTGVVRPDDNSTYRR